MSASPWWARGRNNVQVETRTPEQEMFDHADRLIIQRNFLEALRIYIEDLGYAPGKAIVDISERTYQLLSGTDWAEAGHDSDFGI